LRILFIVAKLQSVEPFGVMCLAPHLTKDGHSVHLLEAETPGLRHQVEACRPDVIGYSVCTGSQSYYLALNRFLKASCSFVSVFGGPHPTFFPQIIQEPGVDAICLGEGEHAFAEFCRELERSGRPQVVRNFAVKTQDGIASLPPRPLIADLDGLPFPDRELYYRTSPDIREHPVRSFLASRGCPFACTYCFNPAMDDLYEGAWRHVRVRSPAGLVDEIASVKSNYPTEFVAFRESIFPLDTEWLAEFADEYSRRVGLPFYCHLRLDLLTKENVTLLTKAGCYSVNVGIETGNETLRRDLLGRRMSNPRLLSSCRLLKEHGIRILSNNMLGLPGGSYQSDMETLKLNQACQPDYALAMLWQPYPGTALARYAETHGFFDGNYEALDFSYYHRSHIRFGSSQEKRRIENLQKLFAVAVLLPKWTWLVRLLTRLPPNPVFRAIFRTGYLIFHQTEIFPHRKRVSEWLADFHHIIYGR